MIQLFQPRGRMVAGLYYKGVLFYTLFIINRLLFLLSCKGYHIIVKQLCSFNKDKIKSVKKYGQVDCMKIDANKISVPWKTTILQTHNQRLFDNSYIAETTKW